MTPDTLPPARRAMIDSQLRTSGINDPLVLARMGAVAREEFLPADRAAAAYADRAVPLDGGAALASPVFYGALLAEARPLPGDRVLVVENGTGYLSALVQPLVAGVDRAAAADAAGGRIAAGSYDLILVDGAIEDLPAALADALAEDGRIVTGLVENGVTRLARGRKAGGAVALLPVHELGVPRIAAFDRAAVWSF